MDNNDVIGNSIKKIYFGIICFLFSIMLAGSVLGVTGLYKPLFVLLFVILSVPLLFILVFRNEKNKKIQDHSISRSRGIVLSDTFIYLATFVIILFLILIPTVRWPESIAGDWFPWDAGKYHFPKAVEMVRSGSANDMTIAYSEYPFGYESLLSFCLLLTGDASLFGWMHAIIDLFFILSFWLLAIRITKINASFLLFLITLLILSNYVFQFLNLWRVFQPEVTTVGKNDLLLSASILSLLYFYPYSSAEGAEYQNYYPLGLAGMIALSVKPNAVYVLGPLWIILGVNVLKKTIKSGFKLSKNHIFSFFFSSLLLVGGIIWLLRNLLITKNIFSDYVLEASKWSISANLTNPFFLEFIPKNLIFIVGLLILLVWLSIKRPQYQWAAGIYLLLFLGFIFTPVTAFFLRTDVPAVINWRFGESLLAYIFIILLMLFTDFFKKLDIGNKININQDLIRVPFVLLITIGIIWSQKNVLQKKPENAIILKDQFRSPVGVNGYYSAYDYVQRNVRNSVVWVENGLEYYVYGPGYSNTVSREDSADYIVVIKTDWFGEGGMQIPSYFDPDAWVNYYQVVYEDPQGIVFALLK